MEKIVKTSDTPSGNINTNQRLFMREINLAPTFDRKSKPWQLVKIPKSSTQNVAWHVRFGEDNFLAIQICGSGHAVSFFATDKRAKEINRSRPLKTYNTYVDLESAVDKFYKEEYETKITDTTINPINEA